MRLSKRDLLRLSKKSVDEDLDEPYEYEVEDLPDIHLSKKDLLRLSKKAMLQALSPQRVSQRSLRLSKRSLRLSKRSTGVEEPMVIRLSKRQIGQLLNIKREGGGGLSMPKS